MTTPGPFTPHDVLCYPELTAEQRTLRLLLHVLTVTGASVDCPPEYAPTLLQAQITAGLRYLPAYRPTDNGDITITATWNPPPPPPDRALCLTPRQAKDLARLLKAYGPTTHPGTAEQPLITACRTPDGYPPDITAELDRRHAGATTTLATDLTHLRPHLTLGARMRVVRFVRVADPVWVEIVAVPVDTPGAYLYLDLTDVDQSELLQQLPEAATPPTAEPDSSALP